MAEGNHDPSAVLILRSCGGDPAKLRVDLEELAAAPFVSILLHVPDELQSGHRFIFVVVLALGALGLFIFYIILQYLFDLAVQLAALFIGANQSDLIGLNILP